MRLICPNCGAQYEVDGSVIPETGRDVQCSNCGNTWFQRHATQAAEEEDQNVVVPEAERPSEIEVAPDQSAVPEQPDDNDPIVEQPPAPERQAMDPEVADVLREEAELETSQRNPVTEPPEQAVEHAVANEDSIFEEQTAQLHSDVDETENTRRDVLPDIEEINSTLAATSGTSASTETTGAVEQNRRFNFRRGFLAAMAVFAVMALVYVFAPSIVDAIPQSTSVLTSYVNWINGLRLALDNSMLGAVDKLTGLLAQLSGDNSG